MSISSVGDGHIFVEVKDLKAFFDKAKNSDGKTIGRGQFDFVLHITALQGAVYIPTSIASGKKPTGFVYQIEGTAQGSISSASVSAKGEGVSQVTLGTLVYTKIPQGKTAACKAIVMIEGSVNKEYGVVINRINYKLDPSDARYKKFDVDLASRALEFKY